MCVHVGLLKKQTMHITFSLFVKKREFKVAYSVFPLIFSRCLLRVREPTSRGVQGELPERAKGQLGIFLP